MNQSIKSGLLAISFVSLILFVCPNRDVQGQKPSAVPYTWKSVQMVGGGFVDGIVFHPKAKGVRYCRTDMGGAYRWNDTIKRWEPMLDWLPYEDTNLMGVESIAVDPADPDRVYLSCGTYTSPQTPNGAILRSSNRGRTFQRTNVPFKMGGNENGRGNGERMAVDPNNGNIIYLGTRNAGLWRSMDKGVTWNKVDSFLDVTEPVSSTNRQAWWNRGAGIIFVVFDPSKKVKKIGSTTIYVGVSLMNRNNLFRSTDGGKTWKALPGQPVIYRPTHAVLAPDGNMYITYGDNAGPGRMSNGGVWKLNTKTDEWKEITPDKPDPSANKSFGYAAVSVDSHNPQVLIVSSFNRSANGGDDIFRSLDGGQTWKPVFGGGGTFDYSLAPYISHTGIHWLFDIEIDPFDSNHAMFTTGYGGHETFNLTDMDSGKPTKWNAMSTGIEETVALELLSPPKGAQVITAIGDYCGFTHWNLDKPEPAGCFDNPHFGNTNGLACAESKPEIVVRVGIATQGKNNPNVNIAYSLDYGKTWQPTDSMPGKNSRLGHIAVSSNGNSWIWTPDRSPVFFTTDRGKTWVKSKGIPDNTRVIADRVNPDRFYAISLFEDKLFISKDGGASFEVQPIGLPGGAIKRGGNRGDSRGGQDRIYATPGKEGDLWIAAFDGLYHSTDTGKSFVKLNGVQEIHAFGFGKAAPGKDDAALYLVGVVNGLRGIFRSDDKAQNWVRINDDQHQWGLILHITGDPKKYGRVYVGTHGRGTLYGDPVGSEK